MRIAPWLEPTAWCAFALLAATIVQGPAARLPHMSNDSCQYVSAAAHLRTEHRLETSLVYYDTERSHGVIPSPLTWFPPGYPMAIALTSAVAGSYDRAALWVCLGSFALITGGLWLLMRLLDPSLWAARAAALCWIANSEAQRSAATALSEPLFALLALACLIFLMHADDRENSAQAGFCWIGAAVMAGLTYWVRYAGLLWIAAFFAVLFLRTAFGKGRRLPWRLTLAAAASAVLIPAPLITRNLMLVGDWRGGNITTYSVPIRELAVTAPKVWYHIIVGHAAASQIWLPVAIAALGLAGVVVAALVCGTKPAQAREMPVPLSRKQILLTVTLVYSLGIVATALRSVVAFIPRFYVPVVPQLIALSVIGVAALNKRLPASGPSRKIGFAMAGCLLFGYVASNALAYAEFREADDFQSTAEALLSPAADGRKMRELLSQELAGGEVIASTDGQMVGCVLNHPTLALAGPPFSDVIWTEQLLHTEMVRFGARHLLIRRQPAAVDSVIQDSPFLAGLASGSSVPWLQLVARNRDISLYRLR